jgi:UDP-N-acetylmuramate dehydrogenase
MLQNFKQNKLLSELCTFNIGGPARFFIEVRSADDMRQTLITCREHSLPYFILGKGSNCLFDDKGFNGVVILNKIDFLNHPSPGTYHVGAGYSFSLLGTQTARHGFSGLEFASGIPGSVGGAVFMNAGANGTETCFCLTSVEFMDEKGELHIFPKSELHFSYRHSPFQKMKGAIISATFTLTPSETARTKQIEIINNRKKTQPLNVPSAGCIFKNPNCGHAGALIDQSGLKGTNCGGAQVSPVHANYIVNSGNATAQDVLSLITLIKKTVKEKSGADLESEVRFIAYEDNI